MPDSKAGLPRLCGWIDVESREGTSMLRRMTLHFVVVILAITILTTNQAIAQVAGATLSGTITDPSGAAIANAQLTITNKATGVTRPVTADFVGFYSAPNLLPGDYEVTISASGFSTTRESNVTLTVGAQQVLDVALRIGEASQTVVVTESTPQVQLSSSTLSSEVESATVRELPLNGRDWASLATLTAGVNAIETQMPFENGAVRGNRGFGNQLTISGAGLRKTTTDWMGTASPITPWAGRAAC